MERLETEVAIVGGGVMGLAAAHALTATGVGVVLLERFRIGHAHGSSHGSSRIFRLVYADPAYAALAQAALPLWRELETETGEQLLTTTGSLDVGSDLAPFARALAETGVAHELLDARELRARLPELHPAPGDDCLFQPDGGIVHADRTVRALHDAVAGRGASILEETRVRELEPLDEHVVVRCDGLEVHAATAVVAGGAWAAPLAATAGIELELRPTRETVVYVDCAAGETLPTVIDHDAGVATPDLPRPSDEAYGLPAPGVGLKVGVHQAGGATDPEEDGVPDAPTVAAAVEWAGRMYGIAPGDVLGTDTCIYTNTLDSGFVLERHGRIVVASACSGHGFKFAPAIGRRVAELAAEPVSA